MFTRTFRRAGLTLIELLIVVAILAVLAAVIVPHLTGMTDAAKSATAASNLGDSARAIETYQVQNDQYPDGWDLLTTSDMTGLSSKLHPNLTAILTGPADVLGSNTHARLALRTSVNHVYPHDDTVTPLQATTNQTAKHISSSAGAAHADAVRLVTIDKSTAAGKAFLSTVFNISTFSDAPGSVLGDHEFVAFGLGVHTWTVGTVMHDPPVIETVNPDVYYARPIAVFAVPLVATRGYKAKFVGVFAPDGTGKNAQISNYYLNKDAARDQKIH